MEKINNLAVVIIDMQEPFMAQVERSAIDTILSNQKTIISICKKRRIPIILVEYYGYEETCEEVKSQLKGCIAKTFVKKQNSAFTSLSFISFLKNSGIENILISGLFGNACVFATSLDATSKGYKVITSDDLIVMNSHVYQEQRASGFEAILCWYKWNTRFLSSTRELFNLEFEPSKKRNFLNLLMPKY